MVLNFLQIFPLWSNTFKIIKYLVMPLGNIHLKSTKLYPNQDIKFTAFSLQLPYSWKHNDAFCYFCLHKYYCKHFLNSVIFPTYDFPGAWYDRTDSFVLKTWFFFYHVKKLCKNKRTFVLLSIDVICPAML